NGIHHGARQGRQRAHGAARSAGSASITAILEKRQGSGSKEKRFAALILRNGRPAPDPSANLAVGRESGRRFGTCFGTPRQSAHAAALLRDAHGGEWRRPAHGADHPRPRRHFDDADLYARCTRPAEERVRETSSAGESEEQFVIGNL